MDTVLVTGGAGFIGSHLVAELIKQGFKVIILDDLSQGKREWINPDAEFIEGSIADKKLCEELCKRVDGVFHLAAMSRVAASVVPGPFGDETVKALEFCTEQNIIGTQNMLIGAKKAGLKRFVYTSSSAIYGDGAAPNQVHQVPRYLNPYAFSKYVGEGMCGLFSRLYGLSTISLRLFNVYGLRQPRKGPYSLVLGVFLEQLSKNTPLTIHGDGSQSRDFIHVRDIVAAFIAAYRAKASDIVLNVGSGETHSVTELANLISSNQVFQPRRAGDAEVTLADIEKTKEVLNWKPEVSFEEGVKELKEAALRGEF